MLQKININPYTCNRVALKTMLMIQLNTVSKTYKSHLALDSLSLNVHQGEIYALVGPNGAGKTTTINLLLGFLQPTSGEVLIDNMSPLQDLKAVRKKVAYIPENVNLYPYLTGLENLDYFCRLAGMKYSQDQLSEFLRKSGLQKDAHSKRLSGYSKGMRQKVGIAIAYAKQAQVLLLDEPASGLDPSASNELSMLLKNMAEEGATVLMASHDLFRVRETAHRIGMLNQGKLVKELDAQSVSAHTLEELYLDFMKN